MSTGELAEAVRAGDRRALARAITLVESTRTDHREQAAALLTELLPATGRAVRLGISGAPGVGKSTFIDAYGRHLVEQGARVAVLAVDPSSVASGGSILGDKTRMPRLAAAAAAFIRPSPAGTTTGGVARRTREALLLCEAAGYDHVLVETVGVGQAEVAVAEMVDTMALLLGPAGGDDLQGMKRGIMELADLVVITKADGDLLPAARAAAADARQGLALLRRRHPAWDPEVVLTSAVAAEGMADVLDAVLRHRRTLEADGSLERLRRAQNVAWLEREVTDALVAAFRSDPAVRTRLAELEPRVAAGEVAAAQAAVDLLAAYRRG